MDGSRWTPRTQVQFPMPSAVVQWTLPGDVRTSIVYIAVADNRYLRDRPVTGF